VRVYSLTAPLNQFSRGGAKWTSPGNVSEKLQKLESTARRVNIPSRDAFVVSIQMLCGCGGGQRKNQAPPQQRCTRRSCLQKRSVSTSRSWQRPLGSQQSGIGRQLSATQHVGCGSFGVFEIRAEMGQRFSDGTILWRLSSLFEFFAPV